MTQSLIIVYDIFDTRQYVAYVRNLINISSDDYLNLMAMPYWCRQNFDRLEYTLSQNPQKAVIATYVVMFAFRLTLQAYSYERIHRTIYWVGQVHCGSPNQNSGWATAI